MEGGRVRGQGSAGRCRCPGRAWAQMPGICRGAWHSGRGPTHTRLSCHCPPCCGHTAENGQSLQNSGTALHWQQCHSRTMVPGWAGAVRLGWQQTHQECGQPRVPPLLTTLRPPRTKENSRPLCQGLLCTRLPPSLQRTSGPHLPASLPACQPATSLLGWPPTRLKELHAQTLSLPCKYWLNGPLSSLLTLGGLMNALGPAPPPHLLPVPRPPAYRPQVPPPAMLQSCPFLSHVLRCPAPPGVAHAPPSAVAAP